MLNLISRACHTYSYLFITPRFSFPPPSLTCPASPPSSVYLKQASPPPSSITCPAAPPGQVWRQVSGVPPHLCVLRLSITINVFTSKRSTNSIQVTSAFVAAPRSA